MVISFSASPKTHWQNLHSPSPNHPIGQPSSRTNVPSFQLPTTTNHQSWLFLFKILFFLSFLFLFFIFYFLTFTLSFAVISFSSLPKTHQLIYLFIYFLTFTLSFVVISFSNLPKTHQLTFTLHCPLTSQVSSRQLQHQSFITFFLKFKKKNLKVSLKKKFIYYYTCVWKMKKIWKSSGKYFFHNILRS